MGRSEEKKDDKAQASRRLKIRLRKVFFLGGVCEKGGRVCVSVCVACFRRWCRSFPDPPAVAPQHLIFTHRELGLLVTLLGGSSRLGSAWSRSILSSFLRIPRFPTTTRGLRKLSRLLGYPLLSRRGAVARPVPRLAAFKTRTAGSTATTTRGPGSSCGSRIGHRA